jgi:DNA-binding MarR family transcriptional regulator
MADRLKEEIQQTKPFSGVEQEALLNIHRTSGHIQHVLQQMLKGHGLTEPQYNVLRILRGAGSGGLRCSDIGDRMVSRDPDVTRLLERLQRQLLIERRRDGRDRRVIYSRISASGLQALRELDPLVESASKSLLGHMSRQKLSELIGLLEEIRHGSDA